MQLLCLCRKISASRKNSTAPSNLNLDGNKGFCSHSFFISPTSLREVEDMIKSLNIIKAALAGNIDITFIKITILLLLQLSVKYSTCVCARVYFLMLQK